ncbi:glycoside hydrolase family 127 protein [Pelagibacterium xiamenense]|uniref:glycoside hydrolase family 127 protein n=1 Tax=Pelagibacterium xiamenense TaxID=2901140 RepID=UPI001E2A73C2|nr:beta-L-arabinofuranosidase domain-containing protein [Pelagibacterium xiamenense]MCD7060593.1 glycoside hydrolase family 127 protein [Pelagibacterium xiamenense]
MRKYAPADFTKVDLTGNFWRERLETVLTRTIPSQYEKLGSEGILESLELKDPPPPLRIPRNHMGFTTQFFWDSDIGKWIEAAAYALSHRRDATIEAQIDEIVDKLEAGQCEDGYLNFWYVGHEFDKRWTNLRDRHELYNCGHLLEGAIAYFQATGRRKMLDVMERYLDHIRATFGTETGKRRGYPGHQEIEIALVKLYHLTGEKKHLDLAAYFIDERGRQPHYFDIEAVERGDDPNAYVFGTHEYSQSHLPVREQTKVVGHAVRAMYMYAAMADLAADLDDDQLRKACETLWKDVTTTRMYVTGGFGPSASNEGFTTDYDLPNDTAYAETCASVAMIFWAQRMLNIDLDGQYGDMLELALFNGALSGLSRDGEHYFYENKLESDGSHRRWEWHPCPCCTMNVSRLVASVGGYFYSTGQDLIAVHLYGGNHAELDVSGRKVALTETSNFPWSGKINLSVDPETPGRFTVKLRIPEWAKGATASINGEVVDIAANLDKGYLAITREWAKGDVITLDLPMAPERIYANPKVRMDLDRVTLRRGPLVYCLEQVDNPDTPVAQLTLPRNAAVSVEDRLDLFDGIVVLKAEGKATRTEDWAETLYRTAPPQESATTLTAVPYYLWANREPGPMTVWIREH